MEQSVPDLAAFEDVILGCVSVPVGSTTVLHAKAGLGIGPFSPRIQERHGVRRFSQPTGTQVIADKHGFSREEMDAYASESRKRAAATAGARAFARGTLPTPMEGVDATKAELIGHTGGLLAPYKRPKQVFIAESLPKNTAGKLLKRELRARYSGTASAVMGTAP